MPRRDALLVFAMCAVPRLAALAIFSPVPTIYYDMSDELLRHGRFGLSGVPSTYLEPLYPLFLAVARLLTFDNEPLVLGLQIGVASAGGVLLFQVTERLAGRRAALGATLFYAVYPYFVRQSVSYLGISLTVTLAIAVVRQLVLSSSFRGYVWCGVAFGLLMLKRTSFLPMWILTLGWLVWKGRRRQAATLAVVSLAVQAPWLWHIWRTDGGLLPSRLGENLMVTASPYSEGVVPQYDVDLLAPLIYEEARREVAIATVPREQRQRAIDDVMLRKALAHIRAHPMAFLRIKARNALAILDPRMFPRNAKSETTRAWVEQGRVRLEGLRSRSLANEAAHFVARALLLMFAAYGVCLRRGVAGDEPLWLLAGSVTATCIVFFPTTRLLAPAMIVPMFYAGVALDRLTTGSSARAPRQP